MTKGVNMLMIGNSDLIRQRITLCKNDVKCLLRSYTESRYSNGGIIFTCEKVYNLRVRDIQNLMHNDFCFDEKVPLSIELI